MGSKKGDPFERETAALAGDKGKRIYRSGAIGTIERIGRLCGDVIWKLPWFNRPLIGECKHGYEDAQKSAKSMRIKREWFDKHLQQASDGDFYPFFAMKFKFTNDDGRLSKFILIPFPVMKRLLKEMNDLYLELEELKNEQEKQKEVGT